MPQRAEITLVTEGAEDLRLMAQRLRELGPDGGKLMKEVRKRISDAGRPVVNEIRQAVRDIPVKGTPGGGAAQRRTAAILRARTIRGGFTAGRRPHGLRNSIARATSLRQNRSGISFVVSSGQIPESQATLPSHLNSEKGWRHPLFGDQGRWYHQQGHPYFDVTIRKREQDFRRAVERAIADVLDSIGR